MRTKMLVSILLSIALLNTSAAADVEGGVNVDPVIEDTIFDEITHTETTTDLEDWEITLTLSDEAYNNNTTFELTTQMCNNDGVCLAPTVADIFTDDGTIFTSAVTTIEDHSYVNWRVKATYPDDDNSTEKFPESGFYKTWSDCWLHDGEWGGNGCPEDAKSDEEDDSLPALGFAITAGVVLIAATVTRFE